MNPNPIGSIRDDRRQRAVLVALLLFTVVIRLLALQMIHTSFDERDYWFSAKRILLGLPYDEVQHRTVRWGIIIPTLAFQFVFGTHPNVYYLVPTVFFVLAAYFVFRIGSRLGGTGAGFLAALFLVFFPYVLRRAAGQIRPEVFSMAYVAAAAHFFLSYLRGDDRPQTRLVLAAVLMFLAYLAKITNLFFLPGVAFGFWTARRPIREAAIFFGLLFGLFLIETAIYFVVLGLPLGQLSIIMANHLSDRNQSLRPMTFFGLFRRYLAPSLLWYWQLTFLAAVPAALVAHRMRRGKADRSALVLAALAAGFLFGITFAVKRLNPVVPAEPFNSRYFSAVLVPLAVILGLALHQGWRLARPALLPLLRRATTSLRYITVLTLTTLLIVAVTSTGRAPNKVYEYFANPARPQEHTLARTAEYWTMVNEAWTTGVPIVSTDDTAGRHAVNTATHFFLADDGIASGPVPLQPYGTGSGFVAAVAPLATLDAVADRPVLVAARGPFRVYRSTLGELQTRPPKHDTDTGEE